MGTVQALREQGFKGAITIVSSEPNLPIDRTKLSKALIADESKIQLRPRDWYKSSSVETGREPLLLLNIVTLTLLQRSLR